MIKLCVLVLLIVSSTAFAADDYPAFQQLGADFKADSSTAVAADNMPPVRSQDGLQTCYAFSAWTLFTQYQCQQSGQSCSNLDPSKTASPLYFAALSKIPADRTSISNAGLYTTIPHADGGASGNVLTALSATRGTYAESCYPYDQFVASHKNNRDEMETDFNNLQKEFIALKDYNREHPSGDSDSHPKEKTEGEVCEKCLLQDQLHDSLKNTFNLDVASDKFTAEISKISTMTFDSFLYDLFIGSCKTVFAVKPPFKVDSWPQGKSMGSYSEMIAKAKEILGQHKPFTWGACLTQKNTTGSLTGCPTNHDFVISGYRKYCNAAGQCRDALRIQNSWGQDWQDQHNDGWVDAQTLYEYADHGPLAMVSISKL